MKLTFRGGFGEKGRTCLQVEAGGALFLLDCGVNTSARGQAGYYPDMTPDVLGRCEAILISHAHEDHVAALGWAIAKGFRGGVMMTRETQADMGGVLAAYAMEDETRLALSHPIETFAAGETLTLGAGRIATGRSGHAVGGVWFHVSDDSASLLYCGDVVPHSAVLAMDAPPQADAILFDASYGVDPAPMATRLAAIRDWLARHPRCLLPTPLIGRSLELLALVDGPIAIHDSMRASMAQQIAPDWLRPGMAETLRARLAAARDWRNGEAFPDRPLLVHDAMGLGGPSADAIPQALDRGLPILFTGHLPDGSPGFAARRAGRADWLRLPTHPTWNETLALIAQSGADIAIPHSTDEAALDAIMAQRVPEILRPAHGGGVTLDGRAGSTLASERQL